MKKIIFLLSLFALPLYAELSRPNKPVFPENRVLGYYGNFESKRMGILGELPQDEMVAKLREEIARWQAADPKTPIIPAIDYVTVTAQGEPGADGKYRLRMSETQINKAIDLGKKIDAFVILDVQIGHSTVHEEVPQLEKYLMMPNVMLALDPEYSMTEGGVPAQKIGTMDADEINFAINYLTDLVKKNNLPPKFLVVHRFTQHMVTDHHDIKPTPEVQVVMDMDGFGPEALKEDSYKAYIAAEPVQFTGVKLFYRQDRPTLFDPEEVLAFKPVPVLILYQ